MFSDSTLLNRHFFSFLRRNELPRFMWVPKSWFFWSYVNLFVIFWEFRDFIFSYKLITNSLTIVQLGIKFLTIFCEQINYFYQQGFLKSWYVFTITVKLFVIFCKFLAVYTNNQLITNWWAILHLWIGFICVSHDFFNYLYQFGCPIHSTISVMCIHFFFSYEWHRIFAVPQFHLLLNTLER